MKTKDLSESQPCSPEMSPYHKDRQMSSIQEAVGAGQAGTEFQTLGFGRSGVLIRGGGKRDGNSSLLFLRKELVSQTQEDAIELVTFLAPSPATLFVSFPPGVTC